MLRSPSSLDVMGIENSGARADRSGAARSRRSVSRIVLLAAAASLACAPAQTQLPAMSHAPDSPGASAGRAAADSASTGQHFLSGFASGFTAGFVAPVQPVAAAGIGGAGFVGTSVHARRSRLLPHRAPHLAHHSPEFVDAYRQAYEERVRQRRYDRAFYGALLGLPLGYATGFVALIAALR